MISLEYLIRCQTKKTGLINKAQQKFNSGNIRQEAAIISSLENFDKIIQSMSLKKKSIPKTKDVDIAMIRVDSYHIICHLKGV